MTYIFYGTKSQLSPSFAILFQNMNATKTNEYHLAVQASATKLWINPEK